MQALATGAPTRAPAAAAVAAEALHALSSSGAVQLPQNVARVVAMASDSRHASGPEARALALALCSACAALGVTHANAPVDAEEHWEKVERTFDEWFSASSGGDDVGTALEAIAKAMK